MLGRGNDVAGDSDESPGSPYRRRADRWEASSLEARPNATATESGRECLAEVAVSGGRDGYSVTVRQGYESRLLPDVTWNAAEPTVRKLAERDDSIWRRDAE
jgi:hypothetical protein